MKTDNQEPAQAQVGRTEGPLIRTKFSNSVSLKVLDVGARSLGEHTHVHCRLQKYEKQK